MTSADRVSIFRGLLFVLGAAFKGGALPTGVDGLGEKIGTGLMALSVSLAAGDKTPDVLKQAAAQGESLPAVQGFISTPGRDNNVLPNSQAAWIQVLIRVVIAALAGIAG